MFLFFEPKNFPLSIPPGMIAFSSIYGDIFPATLDGGYSVGEVAGHYSPWSRPKLGQPCLFATHPFQSGEIKQCLKHQMMGHKNHILPFQFSDWPRSADGLSVTSVLSFPILDTWSSPDSPGCKILVVVQNIDVLKLMMSPRSPLPGCLYLMKCP